MIYINVSDVASLTDHNPYVDSDVVLEKYRDKKYQTRKLSNFKNSSRCDDINAYMLQKILENPYNSEHLMREHNMICGITYENEIETWVRENLPGKLETQVCKEKRIPGTDYIIRGRVDGILSCDAMSGGSRSIIEIKIRTSHTFKHIPIWEEIQVQLYMWLFDIEECIMVQVLESVKKNTPMLQKIKYYPFCIKKTFQDLIQAMGRL